MFARCDDGIVGCESEENSFNAALLDQNYIAYYCLSGRFCNVEMFANLQIQEIPHHFPQCILSHPARHNVNLAPDFRELQTFPHAKSLEIQIRKF